MTCHKHPHRWDDKCARCDRIMTARSREISTRTTARLMREAPGYGR